MNYVAVQQECTNSVICLKLTVHWKSWRSAKMVHLLFDWRASRKRESRYMHLFCGEVDDTASFAEETPPVAGELQARVEALENEVAELKQRLDSLLAHGRLT